MKTTTTTSALLIVTIMLASSVFTQGTGVNNCTPGACRVCSKDNNNNKFCDQCSKMTVVGTSPNQHCEEDKQREIVGCVDYGSDAQGNSICKKCDSINYYVDNFSCVPYKKALQTKHCHTKHPSTDACMSCDVGYTLFIVEEQCVKNTEYCLEMGQGSMACLKCTPGYSPKNGLCQQNTISNCATQDLGAERPKCTKCRWTYTDMLDGQCAKIEVENCLEGVKNDTRQCSKCVDRFYVYQKTSCMPIKIPNCIRSVNNNSDAKCQNCDVGYVTNDEQTKCGAVPEGCFLAVYFANVMCLLCDVQNGYYATDVTNQVQRAPNRIVRGQICTHYQQESQVAKKETQFTVKSF